MKKFRVVVMETQYYEVYVEADTEDKAKDIAYDTYGEDGCIFDTITEAYAEEAE
jgi:hypothetical protein